MGHHMTLTSILASDREPGWHGVVPQVGNWTYDQEFTHRFNFRSRHSCITTLGPLFILMAPIMKQYNLVLVKGR